MSWRQQAKRIMKRAFGLLPLAMFRIASTLSHPPLPGRLKRRVNILQETITDEIDSR